MGLQKQEERIVLFSVTSKRPGCRKEKRKSWIIGLIEKYKLSEEIPQRMKDLAEARYLMAKSRLLKYYEWLDYYANLREVRSRRLYRSK